MLIRSKLTNQKKGNKMTKKTFNVFENNSEDDIKIREYNKNDYKSDNQKLAESFGLTLDDFSDDQSDLEDLKEIVEGGK
jgi:hypothetical protein